MVRKGRINSIKEGELNGIWGIIEDTYVSKLAAEKVQPMGITDPAYVRVKRYTTGAAVDQEVRGLLLLKLPKAPENSGAIKEIKISLYCTDDQEIAPDATEITATQVIGMWKIPEVKVWSRDRSSWERRIELQHVTGGAEDVAEWNTNPLDMITGDPAGAPAVGAWDTNMVAYVNGNMVRDNKRTVFSILNNEIEGVKEFEWETLTTLLLCFVGPKEAGQCVAFASRDIIYTVLPDSAQDYAPLVDIVYDILPPDTTGLNERDVFLEKDIVVVPNKDADIVHPVISIVPNSKGEDSFEKYICAIYDAEVRGITGSKYAIDDTPTWRDPSAEMMMITPKVVTTTFAFATQNVVIPSIIPTPLTYNSFLPLAGGAVAVLNISDLVLDSLPGVPSNNFGGARMDFESFKGVPFATWGMSHTVTDEAHTNGVIWATTDKTPQRLRFRKPANTQAFDIVVSYYNPRNAALRRTTVDELALTDPVEITTETLTFTTGVTERDTKHYVDELLHVAIKGTDVPDIPIIVEGDVDDRLVAMLPSGIHGPVIVTVFERDPKEIDMIKIFEDLGQTLPSEIDFDKDWGIRVWSRTRSTELDKPLRSNEIVLKDAGIGTPVFTRTPAGSPETMELIIANILHNVANLGDGWSHIDFTFFSYLGAKVFVRKKIGLDKLSNAAYFRYPDSGSFNVQARYYSESSGMVSDLFDPTVGKSIVIANQDPLCRTNVYPARARLGDEITFNLDKSKPGAGNVGFTQYKTSSHQDFTTDDPVGEAAEALTLHSPGTSPIRRIRYNRTMLGGTYPKVVRVTGYVQQSGGLNDTDYTDIIILDSIPLSLEEQIFRGSAMTALNITEKRNSTTVPGDQIGSVLVDQGPAGYEVTVTGKTEGGRVQKMAKDLKDSFNNQRLISINIPRTDGVDDTLVEIWGRIRSSINFKSKKQNILTWSFKFFVEKEVVSLDGLTYLDLKIGDAVPGAWRGNIVDESDVDIPSGHPIWIENLNEGKIYIPPMRFTGGILIPIDPEDETDLTATWTVGTVTLAFTGASTYFSAGDRVIITGAANPENNGICIVSNANGTTLFLDATQRTGNFVNESGIARVRNSGDFTEAEMATLTTYCDDTDPGVVSGSLIATGTGELDQEVYVTPGMRYHLITFNADYQPSATKKGYSPVVDAKHVDETAFSGFGTDEDT